LVHLVTDPRSFAAHRLNPITTRPLLEAVTGRDEFRRPQNLQGQVKDVAKGIMPIPLQALTRPGDYDIKESAAKGVGITAYRYRSRAARTAHELVLKGGFGESTRTPAEQKLMSKYRRDIDAGKLDAAKVREDYKAGKLRERDARTLIEEAKTPQTAQRFSPPVTRKSLGSVATGER
jgi:hypothetical protein